MARYFVTNLALHSLVIPYVAVHLRNSNIQHLILAKFHTNYVVGNQSTKFQVNLLKQTKVTVTFVRSP